MDILNLKGELKGYDNLFFKNEIFLKISMVNDIWELTCFFPTRHKDLIKNFICEIKSQI